MNDLVQRILSCMGLKDEVRVDLRGRTRDGRLLSGVEVVKQVAYHWGKLRVAAQKHTPVGLLLVSFLPCPPYALRIGVHGVQWERGNQAANKCFWS